MGEWIRLSRIVEILINTLRFQACNSPRMRGFFIRQIRVIQDRIKIWVPGKRGESDGLDKEIAMDG